VFALNVDPFSDESFQRAAFDSDGLAWLKGFGTDFHRGIGAIDHETELLDLGIGYGGRFKGFADKVYGTVSAQDFGELAGLDANEDVAVHDGDDDFFDAVAPFALDGLEGEVVLNPCSLEPLGHFFLGSGCGVHGVPVEGLGGLHFFGLTQGNFLRKDRDINKYGLFLGHRFCFSHATMKNAHTGFSIVSTISVLGILLLLGLQYVWFESAYQTVERELMVKSTAALQKSIEAELYNRGCREKAKIKVKQYGYSSSQKHSADRFELNSSAQMNVVLHDIYTIDGLKINLSIIDSVFKCEMSKEYGYVPKHHLTLIHFLNPKQQIKPLLFSGITRKKLTILYQVGIEESVKLEVVNPSLAVLTKAKNIFILSLIMVILLVNILVLQYFNVRKNSSFASFISVYTRMVAHDLRSPIAGFKMMFSHLQKNKSETADTHTLYNDALTECDRLLLNLDNLLYVAHGKKRHLPIQKTPQDVCRLVNEVAETRFLKTRYHKTILIHTECCPERITANLDTVLMHNILLNLLENAIKYSGKAVSIHIHCKLEGDILVLSVRDDGYGIDLPQQKRIFNLFEREENASSDGSGFGIGLHFVQQAVQAHGGAITLESTPGQGSCFTLTLPRNLQMD
jgi:signal transduction histidine kinase